MELILPEESDARQKLVSVYQDYLDLLGRPPDPVGLFDCSRAIERGASAADLREGILGSDEYRRRQEGGPDRAGDAQPETATGLDVLRVLFGGAVPVSNRTAYRWWLDEQHARRRRALERGPATPEGRVLFIMPIGTDYSGEALQTIASVVRQDDPRWRMLIVAGTIRVGRAVRMAAADRRITIVRGYSRIAGSARLRRALRTADAAMACFLGPGEVIATITVGEVLSARDSDVVLTDGDRLDAQGRSHTPDLAAGWDPDIALIREPAGLVAIRSKVLLKGWRGRWGRADRQPRWEALLSAAATVAAGRIRHLPSVLLHRPPLEASSRPEPSVVAAFLKDVQHAPSAALVDHEGGRLRVRYPLPSHPPLVSVVVATRDRPGLLKNCADGVLGRTDYGRLELVIVDNGSATDAARATLAEVGQDPRVTLIREEIPFHWGKLNAAGIRASKGEILVLLNDDIDVVEPGWLRELASQALRPDVGLVGAKLLYPSGGVQHAGIVLDGADAIHVGRHAPGDYQGYRDQLATCRTVSAVTGACVAMRRTVYDEIDGFENDHLGITWGDIDLCFRVRRRGYRVVWTPHTLLHHIEQATRGPDTSPETQRRIDRERAYMRTEWGAWIESDPYFSPNLNSMTAGPTLRTAPRPGADGATFS